MYLRKLYERIIRSCTEKSKRAAEMNTVGGDSCAVSVQVRTCDADGRGSDVRASKPLGLECEKENMRV